MIKCNGTCQDTSNVMKFQPVPVIHLAIFTRPATLKIKQDAVEVVDATPITHHIWSDYFIKYDVGFDCIGGGQVRSVAGNWILPVKSNNLSNRIVMSLTQLRARTQARTHTYVQNTPQLYWICFLLHPCIWL